MNASQNLLVELFVEELPPKALKKLGDAFAGVLFEQLKTQGLTAADSALTAFASPRRLAAHVTAVAAQAVDKAVSQKLMPVAVGLDASGNATPALLKKLQALGADASAVAGLKRAPDGKAEALFYDSNVKGATLVEGLQKALLEAIAKLPIPKVMTYQLADGWSDVKFVRPAHGLVALHGNSVVAIEALGLKAGNITHGHRFEAAVDPVVLKDADAYAATLQKDGAVIASFAARKAEIIKQLAAAAAKVGGGARAIEDDALLDEVTALVERPNVLVCEFEKEFLGVPQECLILTMKANQKYFPLLDASGKLTNKFLVVSNISPTDASAVIGGNERVVRPRLADAKFFFDQDRKKTLASRVEGLGKVVYHNKLGTQGERVERVRAIAKAIGQQLGGDALAQQADQAAQLAKTDLVTDMVGEFPELQGTMGRYYALNDGLSVEVADAIEDHYKPRFAGDSLPRNQVGLVVALADKLETLVGMFGIGNLPTGDKDPFALRRHALGVIRMLVEQQLPFTVGEIVKVAVDAFPPGSILEMIDGQPVSFRLYVFLEERASGYLRDLSYTAQEASALFSIGLLPSVRLLPAQYFSRLDAIREAEMAFPADFAALANADKRARNILVKSSGAASEFMNADPTLMTEDAEKVLLAQTREIRLRVDELVNDGKFKDALLLTVKISKPVTEFFNSVMVNAEQEDVRLNRFRLLHEVTGLTNRVVDLSKLAT
jgi:glycyl-tRNA synthetase beta chain